MIVNPDNNGWEVIYQRAHALLAMQLAAHWRVEMRPIRWEETLAAIAQHDDGGREWQGQNHLTEAGAPQDFALSPLSDAQPRDVCETSQYQGRWVALLTSLHVSTLYEPMRGNLPALDDLLDQQQDCQKRWRQELGIPEKDIAYAYALMHWADRLSLILCRRELPNRDRALEIMTFPDGTRYEVVKHEDDGGVRVMPWPFEEENFTVSIEATYLDQLQFKDDEALIAALKAGEIRPLEWTFIAPEK